MEPAPIEAPASLTELGRKIEVLLNQQIGRIRLHFSEENDYRKQDERTSGLMFHTSIGDEERLEYARAKIKLADSYIANFIGPLQKLNEDIERKLVEFERLLHVGPNNSVGVSTDSASMERWLSLSKKLHRARVMATNGIITQTEFDKRVPVMVIRNNGRNSAISEEESKQFLGEAEAYVALIKTASEEEEKIKPEHESLARQLFAADDKAKAAVIRSCVATGPTKAIHPLEGKAWFRLMKVIYATLWIVGLGMSALLAYAANEFYFFIAGAIILAIVLIALKKAFYYVVLGRATAMEQAGKGFVDLEDLRNDFAEVQANDPKLYEAMIVPLLQSWQERYGRRVPVHELNNLQERISHEMDVTKNKYQTLVDEAARKGGTIKLSDLRKKLEQSMDTYEGADRQEYIQSVERFLVSLETKFGTEIPVDEASKILDRIEDDIRARGTQREMPV
ncbi:MAG: hypothetical protein LAP86_29995 [Acidobacteriia bacterium]|nr:hypothetical protein [Terriglobia bacterium]